MIVSGKYSLILFSSIAILLLNGCKKEDQNIPKSDDIEWMHVIDENITGATENDIFMGQNGKILTDKNDNIYLFYYSAMKRQTVVIKCDSQGKQVWRKTIDNGFPMDMELLENGTVVVALRDMPGYEQIFNIAELKEDGNTIIHPVIQTNSGGSAGVLNANMIVMPNQNIVISGVYLASFLVGFPYDQVGFFLNLDQGFQKTWNFITSFNGFFTGLNYEVAFEQNSIIPTSNGKFITQLSYKTNQIQGDSLSFGLATALVNPDSLNSDFNFVYQTGYLIQSNGKKSGYYNQYANELIPDGTGGAVYHYSGPVSLTTNLPANVSVPNGFIRLNNHSEITDTIPIPLPEGYRILSCTKNTNQFLMTAYKIGGVSGSGDYRANQTLFLVGDGNYQTVSKFTFQEFYSDFFPSSAPASDGGFYLMGKIQSFNGPTNKLILIKWKNPF